jgi:hypothetical protein
MMSAMTAISPVTGELMVPGNAGVVIQSKSGDNAIRVGGTAMASNMTLAGANSTLNQIQFFSNGNIVSAFDESGLYFPDSKGVYFGNAATFGALTYASNATTLSAPTTINLKIGATNVASITSTGISSTGNIISGNSVFIPAGGSSYYITDNFNNGSPTGTSNYYRMFAVNNNIYHDWHGTIRYRYTNLDGSETPNAEIININQGGININYGKALTLANTPNNNIWQVYVNNVSQFYLSQGGGYSYFLGSTQANANWNWNSDERLKENIELSPSYLQTILSVPIKTYNYKKTPGVKCIGYIAQDLQKLPELIDVVCDSSDLAEDGTPYLAVSGGSLLPYLIKAFQEEHEIVKSQQIKINLLEEQLLSLKLTVDALVSSKANIIV